jgi:hypothetical protein
LVFLQFFVFSPFFFAVFVYLGSGGAVFEETSGCAFAGHQSGAGQAVAARVHPENHSGRRSRRSSLAFVQGLKEEIVMTMTEMLMFC